MRIFILCTGRSGSKAFINACQHISNYSAGHESLSKNIGDARFDYPDNHIEADNRLSWFLGTLDSKYGDDALYVHLKRNKEATVKSFGNRWQNQGSIIKAFSEGIMMQGFKKLSDQEKETVVENYYDSITDNIKLFLKDKTNTLTINLENIKDDFREFYNLIEAKGDLDKALASFDAPSNTSSQSAPGFINTIKNKLKR